MERRALSAIDEQGLSRISVDNFTENTMNSSPKSSSFWGLKSRICITLALALALITANFIWTFGGQGDSSDQIISRPGLEAVEEQLLALNVPKVLSANGLDLDTEWDKNRRYGIVIDAGSSGSRIYVYSWIDPLKSSSLQTAIKIEKSDEKGLNFELKSQPGLSTFSADPSRVGEHLDPLLRFAMKTVPERKRPSTPVYLFATAGMRLVEPEPQKLILSQACSHVKMNYNYYVGDCAAHFRVISGEFEGILGWLTVNYLKTKFDSSPVAQTKSYGFIDMGGASAQIAFEPTAKMSKDHSNDLYKVSLRKLNGQQEERDVFVTTFLGFGANKARDRYIEKYAPPHNVPFSDPCLNSGLQTKEDEMEILGTGNFTDCYLRMPPLLNKDMVCHENPCLFNGVHAPIEDFGNHKFLGVSELWYTTSSAYDLGGPYNFEKIMIASKKLCDTPWKNITDLIADNKLPHVDGPSRMKLQCFKSAYLMNFLHEGFGIPTTKSESLLETIDDLSGFSVSWTLGAAFLLASSTIDPPNTLMINGTGHRYISVFFLVVIFALIVYYQLKSAKENVYTDLTIYHKDLESSFEEKDNVRGFYK